MEMSSEDESASPFHPDVRDRSVRERRTPKHLEDYILAYNVHRPALSSPPAEMGEQRGAAAAVNSSRADALLQIDDRVTSHRATSVDMLNVSSLRKLMESVSVKEKEETDEITRLTAKLRQYESRQQRRQQLMEHISSFLMEEEMDGNDLHTDKEPSPAQPPSVSDSCAAISIPHTPSPEPVTKQLHFVKPPLGGCITASTHSVSGNETNKVDIIPAAARERAASPLTLTQAFSPQCPSSPSSVASYRMVLPAVHQEQLPSQDTLLLQLKGPPQHCGKSGEYIQPADHQRTTVTCTPTVASYNPPNVLSHPFPPAIPDAQSGANVTHYYLPGLTAVPTPQYPLYTSPLEGSMPTVYQPQMLSSHNVPPLPTNLSQRSTYGVSQRSTYGVPQPKIPDFTADSEREFANLKLALCNLLEPHPDLSENYKYHVLLEHLKLPEAQMIGQSCRHHPYPYTATMQALQFQYGQPHQLAQSEIAAILTSPDVKPTDARTFQSFALRVHLLVSMLLSLEGPQGMELNCCSHVDRLLSKLPKYHRDGFIEHLQLQGKLNGTSLNPYNLQDLNGWLQGKAQQQRLSSRLVQRYQQEKPSGSATEKGPFRVKGQATAVYHGAAPTRQGASTKHALADTNKANKMHCLFCNSKEHYISRCQQIRKHSAAHLDKWIVEEGRCWRCARAHAPDACTLKKPCSDCNGIHLQVLHNVAQRYTEDTQMTPTESRVYLTPSITSSRVLLKVVPVLLHHNSKSMETFAVLDDGAQRTMILPDAAQHLHLHGQHEILALRTVRTDLTHLKGLTVDFEISPIKNPGKRYQVQGAFTAQGLDLIEQTYPVQRLQRKYTHLCGISLQPFSNARPLVLIGSDNVHLITATKPVRQGNNGGPIAIHTALGWTLQGAEERTQGQSSTQMCLFTSLATPNDILFRNVERLWQLDVLPFRNEKMVVRSREDQEAITLLETRTQRVDTEGVQRYATPLLRRKDMPKLNNSISTVMAHLRSTEKRLKKNPEKVTSLSAEIAKLIQAGYVKKLSHEETEQSTEAWYLPYHLVFHNEKARLVFNCSFRHQGVSVNDQLLPGPTLGPSLLGVLLRFRQHQVAVSGDIRAMFHQIRLLPEDRPLLRFIWRDLRSEDPPDVYEWQVLPFGTTCSPCCAIFALQQHARNHQHNHPGLLKSVEQSFYVDNCLKSFTDISEAAQQVTQLRKLMAEGGFDLRQWASNQPEVLAQVPPEGRSTTTEQWLSQNRVEPQEPALGLRWNCATDTLGYQRRNIEHTILTMRTAYQVLASQYDPLGFIVPYTTRAKVLIQQLWSKQRSWEDSDLPRALQEAWKRWEI
ncbi:uncharacterized protein [Nerophis lumbriciformis]|uniref:uncharacterized protein n=1 Tax=Nerophis lumbriciformis TaxID=546530 RepID=UPI003BAB51D1